jgi:hypothetical protein
MPRLGALIENPMAENVLNFGRLRHSSENPSAAALNLVHQLAEVIGEATDYTAEVQARAEALAKQAVEKARSAQVSIQSAERAAEAKMKEFSEKVEESFNIKMQEFENIIEQMSSRLNDAKVQLSNAEQRRKTAEVRATEAENALKCIEEAIRTRIMTKIPTLCEKAVTA